MEEKFGKKSNFLKENYYNDSSQCFYVLLQEKAMFVIFDSNGIM